MRLHDIRKQPLVQRRKQRPGRGRGTGRGTTAGRGTKGEKARSGAGGRLFHEGGQTPLYRRLPKRGFNNRRFATEVQIVNIESLNRFEPDTEITPAELEKARLIHDAAKPVKVLGRGRMKAALKVAANAFSESAARKIQDAGGETRVL